MTAQADSYYVIMDSIFYEYILEDSMTPLIIGKINKAQQIQIKTANQRNKMIEKFPKALMHLGYDLFHAADGPRIRDKISHGECVLSGESSRQAFEKLLRFITSIIKFYENGETCDFEYESIYMNNLKLVRKHNEVCDSLTETFKNLKVALRTGQYLEPERIYCVVKTFFRPFDETQIVKLLLMIMENSLKALENFSFSCNELFRLHNERKLSSARRQSLQHLIASLDNFYAAFNSILNITQKYFSIVQNMDDDSSDLTDVIKQLKTPLKFSENLIKLFSIDSRNFFVANSKTCEFLHWIDNCVV